MPNDTVVKRKVAGYARVSTDQEEQLTSYEAQLRYYTEFIKSHDNWEFVNVYADEGISGTSTAHRAGFKQMIEDALNGKIDLIVTKSVSRFARTLLILLQQSESSKKIMLNVILRKRIYGHLMVKVNFL